ncbi:hypothetical protein CAEBREN_05749 [Caenorhabditis brenneri]|uniref:BZIP domain-containing protein n=1 Tax=Caenorhabditis brenneri TaxID=135651 RepID=G0PK90_CAEBE|nr:hypothetical protein CAEBREN_05749 [Caenorhabditis brenneri]
MNLLPPEKDLNLGQLGTPALMNQFYPGSKKVDPVYDVNNLPIPDRGYRHQPEIVHDKMVINTDVMLPRAVKGSRSDDVLIQLTHEQNGTVSSSLSPGLLDIQDAESPRNLPGDTEMMDFEFDPGPDQDGGPHFIQFSDPNGSNSNFGSPAFDEHPIDDGQTMEAESNTLAADQERQMGHNADCLPIASAQFVHGTGQSETDADFCDGPQHMVSSGPDVAGHERQLHVEQTPETHGQTFSSAEHVPNSDAFCGLGAQDHSIFCQPQVDRQGGHQAGHGPMGPLSYRQGDYYPQMDEVHQQPERQQHNRNGAPVFYQSYNGDKMVQGEAMEPTFRAHQDGTRHADILYLEQPLEQSGQTFNFTQSSDAPPFAWVPSQQMGCQPGNLVNALSASGASYVPSAQDRSETVGEFCQRRMEMHWQEERQHGALRDEAPQSIGNHFYREQFLGPPTIGDHQAGQMPMGPSLYGQGDHYPQMNGGDLQAERQQYDWNGVPAFPQAYNRNSMVQGEALGHTGYDSQVHLEQTLDISGQTGNTGNIAQNKSNNDASHFVCAPEQPVGCLPGNMVNASHAANVTSAQQASERQRGTTRNGALYREQSCGQTTIEDHQAVHGSKKPLSYGQGDCDPQMDEDHRQAERQYGSIRNGALQVEQQDVFNGTMRPLSYGQGDYHPVMGKGTQRRFTPHGPRQEVLQGTNLRYQGVESGSYQTNSGNVEAADSLTGGPGNCRLDFQWIKMNSRSASLSDHTDDQISSSEESGFYSSPSTPDQTTTDSSTNGLLPPIVTSEEPLNQLFLPNFTVQSKDDEAFQQAQWDILMDYSDEELDRMDNNGFLLIDNNDNSDNNEGSASSSNLTPEKKKRNRRSGIKMTPEQKRAHKKEANRKYSTISRDKKKSNRDVTNRIWKYVQNEIQIQQAAITDVEDNVTFANELLELIGKSSDLYGILQQESQFYMYWKGEISRISDIRRNEDTKVQDALLRKQSAKEKFEKSGVEYQAKDGGKKTTTIGSQKTRALQNHELVKAQYHILVNRHDLRREKFLKGLAMLYFRRTVSRYIQRIWMIPVEVHHLLEQEQKLHQLDKLKNFLRANRHLLKAPS